MPKEYRKQVNINIIYANLKNYFIDMAYMLWGKKTIRI
jgi:hypothetical protein